MGGDTNPFQSLFQLRLRRFIKLLQVFSHCRSSKYDASNAATMRKESICDPNTSTYSSMVLLGESQKTQKKLYGKPEPVRIPS